MAVAFVMGAARDVAGLAGGFSEHEFARLLAELVDLPCLDLSLQIELPKVLSPAVGRLCEAIAEDDESPGMRSSTRCSMSWTHRWHGSGWRGR